ncbi:hypothetical protein Tco_1259580, partial [Tanacetum coccineum]
MNANTIRYALTINPIIYTSCINQFWATVNVKTVNGEVQLQALVDGKKIIITKSTVRRDLQLENVEGVDCLPNATIFEQLTLMGYEKISQKLTFYKAFFSPQWKILIHTILQCLSAKTSAWNEFSSTMASIIICLATNKKFNFSKYIFDSMVKNLDSVGKFLMYPRFIQVFLDKQLKGMPTHIRTYIAPSHTKKIFGNMRRVGKGFSRRETPLFPTMMVQAQEEQGEDNAVNEEIYESSVRDSSLEVELDNGNINKTQSKATPNERSSLGTSLGGGTKSQDTIGDTITQTRSENVSKLPNDLLLARVLDLETTKTTQGNEIASLRRRVKKLEKKDWKRTHKLKRVYKVVVETESLRHEVVVETEVASKDVSLSVDEVTLAQALTALKSEKPKADKVVIQEPEQGTITTTTVATTVITASIRPKVKGLVIHEEEQATTPTVSSQQPSQVKVQDKGKGIMLHAEEEEEARLAREKAEKEQEANVALIEEWNDIQAKIKADQLLAERLQAREQEELTIKERAKLFQQLLEKRRKHFAAKRAEEKRNRPPTKAQQRSIMVNTLVDFRTELVEGTKKREGSEKKAGDELEQEVVKKQKEVAIDAIPLATKPPSIVDWKIIKEGNIGYFQIIRVDGSSKRYSTFIQMLKSFDREDLETLWKLVKAKHGSTRPKEGYERVLWGDLNTMFEHHSTFSEVVIYAYLYVGREKGRIVGIKRLLDDLRVTAAQLMLLVYKLLLLVFRVNAAGIKVITAERLQLQEAFMLTEKRSKTYQRKNKDCLKIKITY